MHSRIPKARLCLLESGRISLDERLAELQLESILVHALGDLRVIVRIGFRRPFLAVQRRVSAPTLLSPIHCGVNAELTPLSDSIAGVVETAEAFLELRVLRCIRDVAYRFPRPMPGAPHLAAER